MSNLDALVELVKEPERTSVQVRNDLNNHAAYSRRVDGFQGIGAATEMENTKLAEEKNQALFSVVRHLLQSVVNVASLLEHRKPWVVDVPALFLIGCIGFSDAL